MKTLLKLLMLLAAAGPHAAASQTADCGLSDWFNYRGAAVRRAEGSGAYVFSTDRKAVDADGAPNAYHPDDVGKPCGRMVAGLDCPANAGYPDQDWWPSVLARDPNDPGKPYVQSFGRYEGFFVSKTALYDTKNMVEHDPARYVDARAVPYLVFPRPFYKRSGTGRLGDVGFALHVETGTKTAFVVGDVGPSEPLGEGSIGLFEALSGETVNARTGAGVPSGEVAYLLFPYSGERTGLSWPIDTVELGEIAETLLAELGRENILEACFIRAN